MAWCIEFNAGRVEKRYGNDDNIYFGMSFFIYTFHVVAAVMLLLCFSLLFRFIMLLEMEICILLNWSTLVICLGNIVLMEM